MSTYHKKIPSLFMTYLTGALMCATNHYWTLTLHRHCFRKQEDNTQCPRGVYSMGSRGLNHLCQQQCSAVECFDKGHKEGCWFLWRKKSWDLFGYFSVLSCPQYIFTYSLSLPFFLSLSLSLYILPLSLLLCNMFYDKYLMHSYDWMSANTSLKTHINHEMISHICHSLV